MSEVKKAAFGFKDYEVSEFAFKRPPNTNNDSFSIGFAPTGEYNNSDSTFIMTLGFNASYEMEDGGKSIDVINLILKATFTFDEGTSIDEIPDYFYRNSLGIIYPYLRAFVSTLTFQANLKPPMILPIFNLTELEKPFRESVTLIE